MMAWALTYRTCNYAIGCAQTHFYSKIVTKHAFRHFHTEFSRCMLPMCSPVFIRQYSNSRHQNTDKMRKWSWVVTAIVAAGGTATGVKLFLTPAQAEKAKETKTSNLPTYSSDEVQKHNSTENRMWVSFGSGVYDITDFIAEHPGGDKILMAVGGALEPFWELYAVHKTQQVLAILEKYRIGNLDVNDIEAATVDREDPYSTDPKRHPALKPSSLKPFNAEPPMELLVDSFITPSTFFFVRNHLPVPNVDVSEYELEISGIGVKTQALTLQDLKTKFPKKTIISTIQCAGNRRSELNKIKEVKGLDWGAAAISTAEWSGALLRDVLQYVGANLDDLTIKHVHFEGLDTDPANAPYGASIPVDKAFNALGDVLLAYEMNGEPIPRDHGFPVRVIVPGIVGARNVKWLGRIILSSEESDSHWQKRDYKGFSPNVDWSNVDFDSAPAIQELPVSSAICEPSPNQVVKTVNGCIPLKGYAWSGGGRKIIRVDVSADHGCTWHTATLQQEDTPLNQTWSWTLWEIQVPVPANDKEVELICKATDASYNVQPEQFGPIWNLRGVLGNAWHRVAVKLE